MADDVLRSAELVWINEQIHLRKEPFVPGLPGSPLRRRYNDANTEEPTILVNSCKLSDITHEITSSGAIVIVPLSGTTPGDDPSV